MAKSRQTRKPLRDGRLPKAGPKSDGWRGGTKKQRRAAFNRQAAQAGVANAVADAPARRKREEHATRAQATSAFKALTVGSPAHKAALSFLALYPRIECDRGQRIEATTRAVKEELGDTVSPRALRYGLTVVRAALNAARR